MKDYLSIGLLRPIIGIVTLILIALLLSRIELDIRGAIVAVILVIAVVAVCFLPVHFTHSSKRHHKVFSGILYGTGFLFVLAALGPRASFNLS